MKFIPVFVAMAIGLLLGPPAQAQTPSVISKISADDLASLLTGIGLFSVAVVTDKGEKLVIPVDFFNRPVKSAVLLQECAPDGCGRVVFETWPQLRADVKLANTWNRGVPAGLVKISVLKDGTIRLEMSVDLDGGVSRQFIEQSAFAFVTLVDQVIPGDGLN
jgi:hypothetical protein